MFFTSVILVDAYLFHKYLFISGNIVWYLFDVECEGMRFKIYERTTHLILNCKVLTILAVRHFIACDPLSVILTTLDPYLGHRGNFSKIYLNPLSLVVCLRRPGPCSSTSGHAVYSGIIWSMVCIPLIC